MADHELEQWLSVRRLRKPLARNLSMLDGFVTAVVVGPVSMNPFKWIGSLIAVDREAFDTGGTSEFAAIKAVAERHNGIGARLQNELGLAPLFHKYPDGEVDARDWCEGFMAAVNLKRSSWRDVLDPNSFHHGLILPILIYCKDKRGRPSLGASRKSPETELFLKQAHIDIPLVAAAMRQHFQLQRYGKPHPNTLPRA